MAIFENFSITGKHFSINREGGDSLLMKFNNSARLKSIYINYVRYESSFQMYIHIALHFIDSNNDFCLLRYKTRSIMSYEKHVPVPAHE